MGDSLFVEFLFQFLNPAHSEPSASSPSHSSHPRSWTRTQFEELQLLAMHQLTQVLPALPEQHAALRGNTRLLKFLLWSLEEDSTGLSTRAFRGAGNSLHSTGDFSNGLFGGGSKDQPANNGRRSHALMAMQALSAVVAAGSLDNLQDLADQGLLDVLIGFLERPLSGRPDEVELTMRTEAMMLCSMLCDGNLHAQELFGERGVEMLLSSLPST